MSTPLTDKQRDLPWYRQGWPWFLIALPATAVVAGVLTFVLAARSWDGLVVDDYYKQGLMVGKVIERTEHARSLGLSARLQIHSDGLRVELSAGKGVPLPRGVVVTIAHPTHAGFDQTLHLTGDGGVYAGPIAPLSTGRWLFQIEDESRSWRLNGAAYLPTETEIRIDPSGS